MKNKEKLQIAILTEKLEKLTNKKITLIKEDENTNPSFIPESGLSDQNEPRPNRMKRPGEIQSGWILMNQRNRGLYIQDECKDMMIDKYGKDRGIKVWKGLIDAGTGPYFQFATKVAAEKAWLLNELGIKDYNSNEYFQYSYYSLWKEWMRKNFVNQPSVKVTNPKSQTIEPQIASPIKQQGTSTSIPVTKSNIDLTKIKPEDKDYQRISDMYYKASIASKGQRRSEIDNKMKILAQQMANKITDGVKAYRRGLAAEDDNYHDIAEIFFDKAKQLGVLTEDKQNILKEGTWTLPKTEKDYLIAKGLLIRLEAFKKKLYPILGDNELFDGLDSAIARGKELLNSSEFNIKK